MNPGDTALESIIAQLTVAIGVTHDPRLVKLQRIAIGMRSGEQIARMEREQGLSRVRGRIMEGLTRRG